MAAPAQVVIRIVPRGGTKTIQQVINQWEYLSRKGKLELRLSARHLDIPLPPDHITRFARSWVLETGNYDESLPDEQRQQDLTTHIIVSFPPGTDPTSAHAASREWAADMFGSGNGGGRYNYLTSFHTDRDHPHLHVVVNRRELFGREWLKISRRHPHLNYDALRVRMAEISLRHGIVLDATSRAERGITERPITYAEYRRIEREQPEQVRFEDFDVESWSPGGTHRELKRSFDSSHGEPLPNMPEGSARNGRLQSASGYDAQPRSSEADGRDHNLKNGSPSVAGDTGRNLEGRSGPRRLAIEPVTRTTSKRDDRQRLHPKRSRRDEEEQSGAKRIRVNNLEAGRAHTGVGEDRDDPDTSPIEPVESTPLRAPGQTNSAADLLPPPADRPRQGEPNSKRPRDDDAEPSVRKRARDGRSQDG
ncbi:relaxase/mobilization nuclease domain-containing protein [Agrobacterium vitis]|uniref:Type VI secretion protein n=2 Tax=Agrobacterium TaxID=357 RepID=A0A2Z2PVR5_AGRTU|nr:MULTISPECIES: relaxase/mobilization nuclease domain-containing protein [Rhizobium/Agrobacterium group]ASK47054.1 type VI secretion protein [Agrobacterium radiobacter]MCE6078313.1 relaxase/mobilization nuclease domain-containing protein [Agrobacterium vitis]MCF1455792.1 type VI secretion protein [Agrobacterium vitis]MCF1464876.1 type VI secretion protein [Allorhizobium ampelinum]MCF1470082.1 type VI secretion protein [Agrobacterium vitis]